MGKKKNKSGSAALKHRRAILYVEQEGKCFYCGCVCLLPEMIQGVDTIGFRFPDNMATLEHLHSRWNIQRKVVAQGGKQTRVMACLKCNNEKANEEQRKAYNMNPEKFHELLSSQHHKRRKGERRNVGYLSILEKEGENHE